MNCLPVLRPVAAAVLAAAPGLAAPAAVAADEVTELHEVVVTALPFNASRADSVQPTAVLAGDELQRRLAPSLGETLAGEAGVSSTFYGPAASRPLIRGVGGDRVLLLQDGVAALDVSGLSEDHATALEPSLADQLEIIRGPAALLYGSAASGGAINVVTRRIHPDLPARASGLIELRADTPLAERALAGRLDLPAGPVALHVDGARRETDDMRIPGYTQSERLRDELLAGGSDELVTRRGVAPNTWSDTLAGGIGATWVADAGHLGLAYSRHDSDYGIPLEDGAWIELLQDRLDLQGRRELAGGVLQALTLRASANRYEHAERAAGGDVGTRFQLDGRELRATLEHGPLAGFGGTLGVQWQQVDFDAAGEEAFVPPSTTATQALFAFERRDFGAFTLEFGARAERQRVTAAVAASLPAYDETAVSLSAGTLWRMTPDWGLAVNVTRTERHPSSTELYADGPHAATGQFEIGDPAFGRERAITADLGLRRLASALELELSVFHNRYAGFIFLAPTGLEADGLPVFRFVQRDARFTGAEARLRLPLGRGFAAGLSADIVRGTAAGADLPRLPPLRLGARLEYTLDRWSATLDLRHQFEQDHTADYEWPTAASTLVDLDLSWRLESGGREWNVFLQGSNLLDEEARQHSSPLRESMPLPGRGLAAGVRLSF